MKNRLQFALLAKGMLLSAFGLATTGLWAQSPARTKSIQTEIAKMPTVESVQMSELRGTPTMIVFKKGTELGRAKSELTKSNVPTLLNKTVSAKLQAKDFMRFEVKNSNDVTTKGFEAIRFQQYFKGIKVEHGVSVVGLDKGEVSFMNNEVYDLSPMTTVVPALSEQQALDFAYKAIPSKKYFTEYILDRIATAQNARDKALLTQEYQENLPKGELVFVKDFSKKDETLRLAYKFMVYSVEPIQKDLVYIDAENGKLLLRDAQIKHAAKINQQIEAYKATHPQSTQKQAVDAIQKEHQEKEASIYDLIGMTPKFSTVLPSDPSNTITEAGEGDTRYLSSGRTITTSMKVPTAADGADFAEYQTPPAIGTAKPWVLQGIVNYAPSKPVLLVTYNLKNTGGVPVAAPTVVDKVNIRDNDNVWNASELNPAGPYAPDASSDPDKNDVGIDAHFGQDIVIRYWQQVHGRWSWNNGGANMISYVHAGPAFDNAFWNGSSMTYGDGSGETAGFRSLTSLDVCGHEIGHGVCTGTSNLVYDRESGAMNEGLSDIWAAAIENYAVQNVAIFGGRFPDLKPYGIGEQIDASNNDPLDPDGPTNNDVYNALRRMDFPATASGGNNPDMYNGRNFTDQTSCSPDGTIDDNCGVHTNSGVLNKWFYLMSGASPRNGVSTADLGNFPASPARTYTNAGGFGFAEAEEITYATELVLTSNATFAEARQVSLAYIGRKYAPCSPQYIRAVEAWYGVGVGDRVDCSGPARVEFFVENAGAFNNTILEKSDSVAKVGDCRPYALTTYSIYEVGVLSADATSTVTLGGTAEQGEDYDVFVSGSKLAKGTNPTFTFTAAGSKIRSFDLLVYDDTKVEGTETITMTLATTGGASNGSTLTNTITLNDNDVTPTISSAAVTLLNENFETQDMANEYLPTGWAGVGDSPASLGNAQWAGSFNNAPGGQGSGVANTAISGFTAWVVNATLGTSAQADGYDPTINADIILKSPLINATGTNNIRVQLDWAAQGETGDPTTPNTIFDFGELCYSFDGRKFFNFTPGQASRDVGAKAVSPFIFVGTRGGANATDFGHLNQVLPASFNNSKFYLGVRWYNDALSGSVGSIVIDNVNVTASTRNIENVAAATSGGVYLGGGSPSNTQPVLFYGSASGDVIAAVVNKSTHNYGCTTASIERAGTTAKDYQTVGIAANRVTDKAIKLNPTTNNATGAYDITLYYRNTEANGWETATTNTWATANIYKTDNLAAVGTQSGVDMAMSPTLSTLASPSTTGYFAKGSFTTGFSTFVVGKNAVLAAELTALKAAGLDKVINVTWSTAAEINFAGFEVERAMAGSDDFQKIAFVKGNGYASNYELNDKEVVANTVYYYRLKMVDNDGAAKYSNQVSANIVGKAFAVNINPTLTSGITKVQVLSNVKNARYTLTNALGQTVQAGTLELANGNVERDLDLSGMAKGVYLLKVENGANGNVVKSITLQ